MQKINLGLSCFVLLALFALARCRGEKAKRFPLSSKNSVNHLSVTYIDSFLFRQSYVAGDKYPQPIIVSDSEVFKKLTDLGFVKNSKLIVSKFKDLDSFKIKSVSGTELRVLGSYAKDYSFRTYLIDSKKNLVEIKLYQNIEPIKIACADIIEGGFDEILLLRKYYIVGGDNYQIDIYEVTQ